MSSAKRQRFPILRNQIRSVSFVNIPPNLSTCKMYRKGETLDELNEDCPLSSINILNQLGDQGRPAYGIDFVGADEDEGGVEARRAARACVCTEAGMLSIP